MAKTIKTNLIVAQFIQHKLHNRMPWMSVIYTCEHCPCT